MNTRSPRFAYFISSHGFGHAARSCAVMEALWRHDSGCSFNLFTGTPEWFFASSLQGPFGFVPGAVDVGLVQANALEEDLASTVDTLRAWIPFADERIDALALQVHDLECTAVLCDIAPLGIEVARRAGLPSILIENFTWDWIYQDYVESVPALAPIRQELRGIFARANLHLQTEPFCQPDPQAHRVAPLSRTPRRSRDAIRARLGVPPTAPLILLTMGGIEWDYSALAQRLDTLGSRESSPWLLIAGAGSELERQGRVLRLPHHSEYFHPDLIHASDAVIGKLGYSTLAEVAHAGLPFGYIPRPRFPESPVLEAWVRQHLPYQQITGEGFASGQFLANLAPLLDQIGQGRPMADGGESIAELILSFVTA